MLKGTIVGSSEEFAVKEPVATVTNPGTGVHSARPAAGQVSSPGPSLRLTQGSYRPTRTAQDAKVRCSSFIADAGQRAVRESGVKISTVCTLDVGRTPAAGQKCGLELCQPDTVTFCRCFFMLPELYRGPKANLLSTSDERSLQ